MCASKHIHFKVVGACVLEVFLVGFLSVWFFFSAFFDAFVAFFLLVFFFCFCFLFVFV